MIASDSGAIEQLTTCNQMNDEDIYMWNEVSQLESGNQRRGEKVKRLGMTHGNTSIAHFPVSELPPFTLDNDSTTTPPRRQTISN